MQKNIFRKSLTVAIIALFIGASITILPNMFVNTVKANLTEGLVGYWSFDEGIGNVSYDSSGNGNDGILFGATWTSAGVANGALEFDGIDDYVLVPNSLSLNVNSEITIATWINSESIEGPRVFVAKWNDNTQDWSYILKDHNDNDKIWFQLSKSIWMDLVSLISDTPIPTNGTWVHVTAIYDSETGIANLYFNGVLDATCTVATGQLIDSSVTDLLIGAVYSSGITENFDGLIDEVRIYNRALDEDEIEYLYDHPGGQNTPPATPSITGPVKGKIGVAINYNFTTIDSEDDEVYYFIDWGDQTNSSWIGPYPSGDQITKSHIWSKKGTYTIKAKAKDIDGAESNWSEPLSVTIPRNKALFTEQPILLWLLERFPIIKHLLEL